MVEVNAGKARQRLFQFRHMSAVVILVLLEIFRLIFQPQMAVAATSNVIDSISGTQCGILASPAGNNYGQAFIGGTLGITSIQIALTTAHVNAGDAIKIYSSSGSGLSVDLSSLLATFTYSSVSGVQSATNNYVNETFSGSFTPVNGTIYFAVFTTTGGGYDCYDTNTPSYSNSFSWYSSSSNFIWSWPGRGSSFTMGLNHLNMKFIGGTITPTLSTPSPLTLNQIDGTHVGAKLPTNDTNASSYLISVYASDGVTLIETGTASQSQILSPVSLTISPNNTYKLGVTAIGDGTNYLSSSMSSLTSITFPQANTSVSLALASSQVYFRIPINLIATFTSTGSVGKVQFFANGKKIPGCVGISSVTTTATCSWKPSVHGYVILSATFVPSNTNYLPSTAPALTVSPVARLTVR